MKGVSPEQSVVRAVGRVHEALLRLEKAGLTDEDVQKIVEGRDLAEQIVGLCHPKFPPLERRMLERGLCWEIVQAPGEILKSPVTLHKLYRAQREFGVELYRAQGKPPGAMIREDWHGEFDKQDINFPRIDHLPLEAGEMAWNTLCPVVPGSERLSFEEQERLLAARNRELKELFGSGVKAVFASAEQILFIFFTHYLETGMRSIPGRIRTANQVVIKPGRSGSDTVLREEGRLVVERGPMSVNEDCTFRLGISILDDRPGYGALFELLVPDNS